MSDCAAEFFGGNFLMGDGFDDFRAGHKHIGRVLYHKDKVGHRRRIHRAAGAGTHDHRYLRDHPRSHHVALKHLGIAT